MLQVLDDKISHSSLAAGSDTIKLPKVAIRRLILGAEYTVTDVGISAGENLAGYLDSVQIVADGDVIFRADRDELPHAAALLAPYATDSLEDPDDLDICSVASLYSDATPTTAQEQRAWYVLNFPHDFRQYDDIEMRVTWRAATDEWGVATAMAFKLFVGLHVGNVPRSLALVRSATGSSTIHEMPMGDMPVIAGLIVCATANYFDEIKLKGKDGSYDVSVNEPVITQAMWNVMTGSTPADDDVDYCYLPDMLVAYYPERRLSVELTTAAALVGLFVCTVAESTPAPEATKGDAKRGVAASEMRQFRPGTTGARAVNKASPRIKRRMSLLG